MDILESPSKSGKKDRNTARCKANDLGKVDPRILQEKTLSFGGSLNHRDVSLPKFQEGILSLAEDIIEQGVLSPFEVFFERGSDIPYLIGGHRRRLACLKALEKLEAQGLQDTPAYKRIVTSPCHVDNTPGQNELDFVWKAWKLNDSVRPTKSERASVIKTLIRGGWSESDIKRKMREDHPSQDESYIQKEVREAVILGEATSETLGHIASFEAGGDGVSASFAIEQIKRMGPTEAGKVIGKAVQAAKADGRRMATVADSGEKDFLSKGEGREAITLLRHLYDCLLSPRETDANVLASQIDEFLTRSNVSLFSA